MDTLLRLLQTRLLAASDPAGILALQPQPGLSCKDRNGKESFIIAAFHVRGNPRADIVEVRDGPPPYAQTSDVVTVAQNSLTDLGFRHRVMSVTKEVLRFEVVPAHSDPEALCADIVPLRAALSSLQALPETTQDQRQAVSGRLQPLRVLPAAARNHTDQFGSQHRTAAHSQPFAFISVLPDEGLCIQMQLLLLLSLLVLWPGSSMDPNLLSRAVRLGTRMDPSRD